MTELYVEAIAAEHLNQCGPCDFGLVEYGCNCPTGDPRVAIFRLIDEVNRLRAETPIGAAARAYERAWNRYADPSRYPDAGNETDRILAKAAAHQALLDAVRSAGAS